MKTCSKCDSTTDSYYSDNRASDGLQSQCKACMNAASAARYAKNVEKISEHGKKYYLAKADQVKSRMRQYYLENKDAVKGRARNYDLKNATKVAERRRQKREQTLDASREKARLYYRRNPAQYKARARAREHSLKGAGFYTKQDVDFLFISQHGQCVCCRIKLKTYEIDHIIPLSKGGSNSRENIQLLCVQCNRSKHAKDPIAFMQSRGFLL